MNKPKYNSLSEWRKAEPKAYVAAYNKGLLPEICEQFGWNLSNKRWNLLSCKIDASNYASRAEWKKNNPIAYSIARMNGWLSVISQQLGWKTCPIIWTEEEVYKLAKSCKTRNEFREKYQNAYQAARRFGIVDKACSHINFGSKKWTKEEIHKLALACKTKKEFQEKYVNAYHAARRLDIIDKVCSHLESDQESWTETKLYEIAQKCNSRNDFRTKYYAAYQSALRRKIIDKICSHMKPSIRNKK